MKKIVAYLMITRVFIFSAHAQEARPMQSEIYHNDESVIKNLNLTADQQTQMKANRDNYKQQLSDLDKNESITVKESRDQNDALRKEQKQKMMSILTEDQKNKLVKIKANREAKHDAITAKKLDKVKAKLNLSDDQVAKISSSRKAAHDQFKAIETNDQLSRSQKSEQLMALKTQDKDNFKSILTPDQIAKMEEMKQEEMDKKESK